MRDATEEETKELLEGGWHVDVNGDLSHWLHPTLAPVLSVPTDTALARNRGKAPVPVQGRDYITLKLGRE